MVTGKWLEMREIQKMEIGRGNDVIGNPEL